MAAALVLLPAALSLPHAQATINAMTLVVSQSTVTSTYGSAPPSTNVDVKFLSSGAAEDSVKVSVVLASMPAGQNVQPTLSPISSSGGNVQNDGASSTITPTAQGVVYSQFTVSMSSAGQLSAGTYSLLVLASTPNPSDSLRQTVTFVINPAPTPVISVDLSRIWMAAGSTPASESNNSNTLSANATAD